MPKMTLSAVQAVERAQHMDLAVMARLRPTLVGPVASLRRYPVADERTAGVAYNAALGNTIAWPELAAGEVADRATAEVYLEDARLLYFTKSVGSNGTCLPSTTFPNRVRASNYVFKTGNGTDRSAAFYDRDVAVGDVAKLRAVVASVEYTHTTSVSGFVGEAVAAVVGAAAADAGNHANQGATIPSITQVAGTPVTDVVAAAGGSYNSLDDGYVTRTYTITVIQASAGGDATTARLRVDSGDGNDDQASVTPSAFGVATPIGTKGVTATFSIDPANSSASYFGLSEADFALGQQWTLTVAQAFTAPAVASGGTYTGLEDDTYIVTVTRGGVPAGGAVQVTVTTARGTDRSGPTTVTGSGVAFAVGSYGVTATITGSQARAGDSYTIAATAATEGALRTLTLADDVPAVLRGVEVELKLFIKQTGVELAATRDLPTPAVNWSTTVGGVTVEDGIYLTDASLTDGGDPVPVPLDSATVFVSYRAWQPAPTSNRLLRAATLAAAEAAVGEADPDNPLGWAAARALANTAGQLLTAPGTQAATTTDVVLLVPTGDPSVAGNWVTAYEVLEDVEDAYAIVPLTADAAAVAAAKAHVDAQSTDALGYHRVLWTPGVVRELYALVDAATTSDDGVALGTVAAYPGVTPTEYTLLTATSGNVNFTTAGVRAGDEVRLNYQTDALGRVTYDSYDVLTVLSTTTLRLDGGPPAAVSTPARFEVWRAPTRDELVAQLTAQAAAYAEADEDNDTQTASRVRVVWPDAASFGGDAVDGPAVCAALAGLTGSVASQQGVRNVGLAGVDAVTRSTGFFTARQLDALVAGGVWVVDADLAGNVYVRGAVTCDTSAVTLREEMCVRNGDAMRFQVDEAAVPFLGTANVTDEVFRMLRSAVLGKSEKLRSSNRVAQLGPPVADMTLVSLTQVLGAPDEVQAVVDIIGPVPFNRLRQTVNLTAG